MPINLFAAEPFPGNGLYHDKDWPSFISAHVQSN